MRLSGSYDVIVGSVLIEHQMHGSDVIARKSPISLRFEVSDVETFDFLLTQQCDVMRDLPGDEFESPPRRFMIEQDSRTSE